MDSQSINVAVDQLLFSLFQRPLHPELFKIYASRHVKSEHYEANVWVTGCTHVISMFCGEDCLSEVVSYPGQLLPSRGLVERFQFRGPRTHKCTLSHGISYMTDFQIEKMSPNLYKQNRSDLECMARKKGIFVPFPEEEVGNLDPFCFVDYEARRTELHIQTFAAFPDQLTMIKTQSLFELN